MLPTSAQPPATPTKATGGANPRKTSTAFGGGYPAYVLFCLWLTLVFIGVIVQMAGQAALQHYFYYSHRAVGRIDTHAGIAALSAGDSLRFVWWAWFFALLAASVLAAAVAAGADVVAQARGALLAWNTAALVVEMVACDYLNAVRGSTAGAMKSSARAAFAGCIISIVAQLAAVYHLGVTPA